MASFKTLDLPLQGAFEITSNNSSPQALATLLLVKSFKENLGGLVFCRMLASYILLQKKDIGCISPTS
jgi:hypothetical protein